MPLVSMWLKDKILTIRAFAWLRIDFEILGVQIRSWSYDWS